MEIECLLWNIDSELYERVCAVLFDMWDPIGVNAFAPRGEYDSYAAFIIRTIRNGAGEFKLAEHLGCLALDSMGLSNIDEARDRIVAKRLIELVGTAGAARRE